MNAAASSGDDLGCRSDQNEYSDAGIRGSHWPALKRSVSVGDEGACCSWVRRSAEPANPHLGPRLSGVARRRRPAWDEQDPSPPGPPSPSVFVPSVRDSQCEAFAGWLLGFLAALLR